MSDIKFVGEDVRIEGDVLEVTCFDIALDNAGRRGSAAGRRRALVHDFQDGLTLNWDDDYPGGVTINGNVKMPNGSTVGLLQGTTLRCTHHTLFLDHAARRTPSPAPIVRKTQRRALVHDTGDGLTVNFASDYPGGVTIRGIVRTPDTLLVRNQDVLQLVVDLQARVDVLEARVQALEAAG